MQLLLDVQLNMALLHSYNCLKEYRDFSLPIYISVFVFLTNLNSVGRYCKLTVVVCYSYKLILFLVFDSFMQIFTKKKKVQ
jgi:hypothetical protein